MHEENLDSSSVKLMSLVVPVRGEQQDERLMLAAG